MTFPEDSYISIIIPLFPLAAGMLIFQTNPYHALVVRGILGAISALVYAILGAADVALTEALVGTMLAITLYAVAVRSSLVMRLGVLKDDPMPETTQPLKQWLADVQKVLKQHYMRLELVHYTDPESLNQALLEKEIHGVCVERYGLRTDQSINLSSHRESPESPIQPIPNPEPAYQTTVRVRRLYDILEAEHSSSVSSLSYFSPTATDATKLKEAHP